MMSKRQRRIYLIIISLVFLVSVYVYVYQPFASGNKGPLDLYDYENTGLFRMDPGKMLVSLDNGNMDVFLPDPRGLDGRGAEPVQYTEPILWRQSDHLQIINALDNSVWKGTLDDWSLFGMVFNAECQNLNGLTASNFQYFKTGFDKGKIVDIWREIEIDPEYAYVAWGGGAEFAHPLFGWKSIDMSKIKATAENVIRIAEENGGTEARLRLQDRCTIRLSLIPEKYESWEVDYGYSSGFRILIDPYTGRVIKKFCSFFPDPVEELICNLQKYFSPGER